MAAFVRCHWRWQRLESGVEDETASITKYAYQSYCSSAKTTDASTFAIVYNNIFASQRFILQVAFAQQLVRSAFCQKRSEGVAGHGEHTQQRQQSAAAFVAPCFLAAFICATSSSDAEIRDPEFEGGCRLFDGIFRYRGYERGCGVGGAHDAHPSGL